MSLNLARRNLVSFDYVFTCFGRKTEIGEYSTCTWVYAVQISGCCLCFNKNSHHQVISRESTLCHPSAAQLQVSPCSPLRLPREVVKPPTPEAFKNWLQKGPIPKPGLMSSLLGDGAGAGGTQCFLQRQRLCEVSHGEHELWVPWDQHSFQHVRVTQTAPI